eukprot:316066-Amphidinium_carterae.1
MHGSISHNLAYAFVCGPIGQELLTMRGMSHTSFSNSQRGASRSNATFSVFVPMFRSLRLRHLSVYPDDVASV